VWIGSVISALVVALLGHAWLCRTSIPGNAVGKFLIAGTASGLLLVGQQTWRAGVIIETVAAVLAYAFACELYLFLFTLAGSSVSVGVLLALRRGGLTRSEVDVLCDSSEMVDVRIARLMAARLITASGAGLVITSRGRRLLKLFALLAGIFKHDR
jgi:hypothetical protein